MKINVFSYHRSMCVCLFSNRKHVAFEYNVITQNYYCWYFEKNKNHTIAFYLLIKTDRHAVTQQGEEACGFIITVLQSI